MWGGGGVGDSAGRKIYCGLCTQVGMVWYCTVYNTVMRGCD
jgi:hypothetical protein